MARRRQYRSGGAVAVEPPPVAGTTATTAPEPPIDDDAQTALSKRIAELQHAEQVRPEQLLQLAAVQQPAPPPGMSEFLQRHPDAMTDKSKRRRCEDVHDDLVAAGVAPFSQDYWRHLEQGIAEAAAPAPEPQPMPATEKRIQHSAPVSRSAIGNGGGLGADLDLLRGRVTLSPQQLEAAKISGVTPRQYAENLVKLMAAKKAGNYPGSS
jgi:hypothetical protein